MRMPLAAALLLCSTVLASAQEAGKEFPAKLLGQALLPANTLVPAPADAPADLKVSGKFLTPGKRVEAVGTVMGASGGRPTGLSTPFAGQPVQGFSGIRSLGNGEFLVLTDNGFGGKANSPDAMLFFHGSRPISRAARSSAWRRPSCTIRTRRCRSASSMRVRRSDT